MSAEILDWPGTWREFAKASAQRVLDLPDAWFATPYRSKAEALAVIYGDRWRITPLNVHVGWDLPAFLLTDGAGRRILAVFPDQGWYPISNARPEGRPAPRGRTRTLRSALRQAVEHAVGADSLPDLLDRYLYRHDLGNTQAFAYLPALFDAWIIEEAIEADEAEGLRMLAGLTGYQRSADLMTQRMAAGSPTQARQ